MRSFLACLAALFALSLLAPVSANEEALKAAQQFHRDRDYARAVDSYSKAIASGTLSKQSLINALNGRGLVYEIQQQFPKARADFQKAVETDPARASSHYALAEYLVRRDDIAGAEKGYAKAVELAPTYGQAFSGLGLVSIRREKWPDALGHLDKAIALQGDSAVTWHNRGLVLYRLSRTDEAIASFRIAAALAADPANALAALERLGAD